VIIRFADDFIILCSSEQVALDIRGRLNGILFKRGMQLSEAKTSIQHVVEGFDFLGYNICILAQDGFDPKRVICRDKSRGFSYDYNRTGLYIIPSKKSVDKIKTRIKGVFTKTHGHSPMLLIAKLNPIIRGYANSKSRMFSPPSGENIRLFRSALPP